MIHVASYNVSKTVKLASYIIHYMVAMVIALRVDIALSGQKSGKPHVATVIELVIAYLQLLHNLPGYIAYTTAICYMLHVVAIAVCVLCIHTLYNL